MREMSEKSKDGKVEECWGPVVGDDLSGEEGDADDDEEEGVEPRTRDEQTLPEQKGLIKTGIFSK